MTIRAKMAKRAERAEMAYMANIAKFIKFIKHGGCRTRIAKTASQPSINYSTVISKKYLTYKILRVGKAVLRTAYAVKNIKNLIMNVF